MADPAVRAKISERTRSAMADPKIKARQLANKISELARAAAEDHELHVLRAAWSAAPQAVRCAFLIEIIAAATAASAGASHG